MAFPSNHGPVSTPEKPLCPRCGGSGVLRLGEQRYRTCLDCLGEGRLPIADLPAAPRCSISSAPCVSAAR